MSTGLVLGVVGAVAGSFIPGVGTALGFSIGYGIGNAVDVSKQQVTNEGPRLGELKVQASQYGGAITRLYGTHRIAGNVIASTDIEEHENRSSSRAGKGGPKVTNIEYTYSVDVAIGLCEGVITGVRRIFANGKVVYDAGENATGSAIIASAQLAESITVYTGTEDQLPDPTLEAHFGVGNVPAYRGLAYVVFNDLLLTDYGGRIPQLEFEVIKAGESVPRIVIGEDGPATAGGVYPQRVTAANVATNGDDTIFFREAGVDWAFGSPYKRVDVFAVSMDGPVRLNSFSLTDHLYVYQALTGYSDVPGVVFRRVDPITGLDSGTNTFLDENGNRKTFLLGDLLAWGGSSSCWAKRGNRILFVGDANQTLEHPLGQNWGTSAALHDFNTTGLIGRIDLPMAPTQYIENVLLTDSYAWLLWQDVTTTKLHVQLRSASDFSLVSDFDLPAAYDGLGVVSGLGVNDDDTLSWWIERPLIGPNYSELSKIHPNGTVEILVTENDAVFKPQVGSGANGRAIFTRGLTIFGALTYYPAGDPMLSLYVATFQSLAAQGVPLSDIIAAECALCGVEGADLDVADCTEIIMGYAIARVATTRANLEPLLTATRRDVVESDWMLKFPKRGSAPVVTIPYEDLGAEEAERSEGEPLATTRAQELDLPRSVLVNYINAEQDYLGGTETSRRLITRAQREQSVDVAIVMRPDEAAQVADAIMYDTWAARTSRSLSLLRKYSALESGDVFNVLDREGNQIRLRAVETEYAGPVIKINAVEDDAAVNIQASTGAVAGTPQTAAALPPATVADFLDIPILRDADDNEGVYVALRGTRPSDWRGAVLSRESEDGDLSTVGTVLHSATVGVTDDALGDWTRGNVFDETNTVTITLHSGELQSVSRDAVLNGGFNALLIGAEIVQACDMTFVSGSTWRASRLLRGRRGTEWAQTGHVAGERVVLLGVAGMLRPALSAAELNTEQGYAVQSVGRNRLTHYTFTNTGIGKKPFSPVNLRGLRASNDWTISWDRRTRLRAELPTAGVDVLLGEASERYDVQICSDATFVNVFRTYADLTSPSVIYSSADQVSDFGSNQATIHVRVFQKSTVVGRGYPAQRSLNG